MQLKTERFEIVRPIDTESGLSEIRVEISYNNKNGNVKISPQLSTKHLTTEPSTRAAILEQLMAQTAEAFDAATKWHLEHKANNAGDEAQLVADFEGGTPEGKPKRPKKATLVTFGEGEDGETPQAEI